MVTRKLDILKNVGASWLSLAINIAVGIFLSPFILHRLGNLAYGAWALTFSVTGYYGLFDLGIRSSIIRYVSTYSASDDREGLQKLINTALAAYCVIGAIAFLITLAVSSKVESLFRLPPDFVGTAKQLFLIVGSAVALGFPSSLFSGILEGLGRFYVSNLTNVVSTLLRAMLIVLALLRGHGIVAVALITVILPLLAAVFRAVFVFHLLPLRFSWKYVERQALHEIARYSGVSFIIMIAYKLRFKTDEIVISTFLSVSAVTFFSNGDRLVDYTGEVVSSLAQIFLPMSGQSDAKGDFDQIRRIFILGNRACALVVFPISAVLIILGKSIITAWVGERYVTACYPVMLTLLIPSTFFLAQSASPRILYGMARHRVLAWITSMEGIANLILSILLIHQYGIIGDALGTAIPLTCTALFFYPRHLCRLLSVPLRLFLRQAYSLPLLFTAPTVASLLLIRRLFFADNYWRVGVQILVGLVPYLLCLEWAFRTKRVWQGADFAPVQPLDEIGLALVQTYEEKP